MLFFNLLIINVFKNKSKIICTAHFHCAHVHAYLHCQDETTITLLNNSKITNLKDLYYEIQFFKQAKKRYRKS